MDDGWPTTRCYPRTLNEAFQHIGEGSEWFFPPEQRTRDKVFFVIGVVAWVGIMFYFWKK